MIDTLIQNSTKVVANNINSTTTNDSGLFSNVWFWIAISEVIIILFFILSKRKKKNTGIKHLFKEDALSQNVDFDNILNSSFNSTELYDTLKIKCHPDRFPTDKNKNAIAETLFREINKNKTNIKRLLELKKEAEQKLNVNF